MISSRKEIKKRARKVLKKQYLIFVLICLIAAFIGAEFTSSLSVIKARLPQVNNERVIETTLQGNFEEGKKLATEKEKEFYQNKKEKEILGRSRGALATVVNSISTGSLIATIATTIHSLVGSRNVTLAILIVVSFFFMFLLWFYIVNTYQVIARRLFLEGRKYDKVPIQRFLYLFRLRKWTKASRTMFLLSIFETLWSFTIIGGIIKRYSYYLVPYIVAENPDISSFETITLSRKMMNGYKQSFFLTEFSYIGWEALGVITLGLSKIMYSNPYKVAVFSEYYEELRNIHKLQNMPGTNDLNDTYLFEYPSKELINKEYVDVLEALKNQKDKTISNKSFKAKTMSILGITLYNSKEEKNIEKEQVRLSKINNLKDAMTGKIYPSRLSPLSERKKRSHIETINYLRRYSIFSIIILFFSFSIIGWIWEVSLHLITDGEFVNRGTLQGPWLPIYGTGAVLILMILNKLRKKPIVEFASIMVLCGLIEYFTSLYLEMTKGQRWWDYSGFFLNLHGRICAEGLLVFGLGGMVIVYLAAPLIDNHIRKISNKILIPLCIVLSFFFIIDEVYSSKYPNSGKGITNTPPIHKIETRKM